MQDKKVSSTNPVSRVDVTDLLCGRDKNKSSSAGIELDNGVKRVELLF